MPSPTKLYTIQMKQPSTAACCLIECSPHPSCLVKDSNKANTGSPSYLLQTRQAATSWSPWSSTASRIQDAYITLTARKSLYSYDYDHSRNAWMTSTIFQQWFLQSFVPEVRHHRQKQGLDTSAIVLLDNCPPRSPDQQQLGRGRSRPCSSPKHNLQPLDQCVIQNVKMNYRKTLMKRILEESCTIPESLKKINLKTTFDQLSEAWDKVKPSSIDNCWTHALKEAFSQEVQEDEEENDEDFLGFSDAEVKEAECCLCNHLGVPVKFATAMADWALVDMKEPIAEPLSLEDIIQEEQHPTENDKDQPEPAPAPAAIWHLQQALLHMETNPEVDDLELNQLRSIIVDAKRRARPKQSKLRFLHGISHQRLMDYCGTVIETLNSQSQWCDNRQSETLKSDRDKVTSNCDRDTQWYYQVIIMIMWSSE